MKARLAGFFMTGAQEVVSLATVNYHRVALLEVQMAREKKPAPVRKTGDQISPSVVAAGKPKPARPRAVKVDTKTAANVKPTAKSKTSTKSPAKTAKTTSGKPSPSAARTPAVAKGSTVVSNPIDMTPDQLEAMEIAALQGLDARQAKFCDLYLVTYNGAQSYRDAGYRCKNDNAAAAGASRLLRKVKDHPYYKARQTEMFKRVADIQNQIIGVVHAAAFADPRELVEYVRRCCRYCYGNGFKYQFRPSEMERRRQEYEAAEVDAKAEDKELEPFDELGGLGYDSRLPPHYDCPECSGEGIGRALFKDTSNLGPAALSIFEGVKEGKDGTEIKVASQKGYRELLAKIFDLQVEPPVVVEAGVSREVLEEVLAKAEAKTNAQAAEMRERERMLASLGNP